MSKLKNISRFIILAAAALMVISFFVPVWQILMWAPQYPEGLEMKIWLNTLTGDYKIISGLNHYIGMKHIEVSMFPEFEYMRTIVAILIGLGIVTALINRRWALATYIGLFILTGAAGLIDFYLWGYDYGHNLDPTAPIIVPGMAYQPPLIGTKQLLNFTAYSGPDTGGYLFLTSGLLAIGVLVYEFRANRKKVPAPLVAVLLTLLTASCSTSPDPLAFGKDGCHVCKMTLFDKRFGGEIVTEKGKIFKFDDTSCMMEFIRTGRVAVGDIKHLLVVDFDQPGTLIDATSASLVHSAEIKSPMNGQIAAFSSEEIAEKYNTQWKGEFIIWNELIESPDESHSHH
jgi:copper chaperone NosL